MTTPSSTTSTYDNLLSWALSNGAIIPDTLSFLSTPYGHCQSTVPIPAGTPLFHIPHSLLITPTVADTALPQLVSLPVHARVCAFIALERGKKGFWKDYLTALPERFETPAYFSEGELNVLRGTNLFFAWHDRINLWKEEFEKVRNIIPDINWDDYLWAATVLSSRSFPSRLIAPPPPTNGAAQNAQNGVIVHGLADPSSSDPILIPVMDMLNHRPNHPVTWLTSAKEITFVPETEYPANTEIFNNYGAKGNEELLMGYGFCIPNNPFDSLSLRLPNDPVLYTITRNHLAPSNILNKFCDATIHPRETGLPRTKRNLYEGYSALLNALLQKLSMMGWEDRNYETPAGKYAEMYRKSQRDLLIMAYGQITGELMEMAEREEVVSSNAVVRGFERERKKRKKQIDEYGVMVGCIARILQGTYTDGDISSSGKRHILSLAKYYETSEDKGEYEMEEECRWRQKKLEKRGHEVDIQNIRLAFRIWGEESVDLVRYPDALEAIEELKGDEEELEDDLRGEVTDTVLFINDIPEIEKA